ncbi:MAG: DUF3618 domain-containing protein [Actinomycetota bacterium]|nr:DUF3618 domain-containing protein [Actinomycetota bacterium]
MSNPDEIRAEIAQTRSDLSTNVNALGEAVKPGNVARHQVDKVTSRAGDLKDRVMGSAHDAVHTGADTGSGLSDHATAVPGQVKSRTRGNPLAMGLIALGAGWLVGSLMPATDREAELAAAAKEQAQPLLEKAQTAAQESMEHLKEPAQEAAQSVASRAQEAAETVKTQGQDAVADVKDSAESARQNVQSN